jgi:hypothetical protein
MGRGVGPLPSRLFLRLTTLHERDELIHIEQCLAEGSEAELHLLKEMNVGNVGNAGNIKAVKISSCEVSLSLLKLRRRPEVRGFATEHWHANAVMRHLSDVRNAVKLKPGSPVQMGSTEGCMSTYSRC